jgi:uncharacterized membrane protein HdeD (DUF308 family)
MDRTEASQTLEAVTRARERTRRRLGSSWYARLVIGAFLLGAAAVAALEPGDAVAWAYWVGGLLAGGGLIVAHYTRSEREAGIESRSWDGSMTLLLVMIAALVAANRLTEGSATAVAVFVIAAIATAGFGWLARDPVEAASALPMAVLALVFVFADPSEPGIWINAGIGAILLVAALLTRARERSPRAPGYRSGAAPA